MGEEQQQAETKRKFKDGITVPKWVASVIIAAVLGWAGSWVGYSVHTGAALEIRVKVLESQAEWSREDRQEILERIKRIEDMVSWLTTQISYNTYTAPTPRTADRLRPPRAVDLRCQDDEVKVRAANGDWFCQKR